MYLNYKIQFFLKYESIVACFFFPPKAKIRGGNIRPDPNPQPDLLRQNPKVTRKSPVLTRNGPT